MLEDYLHRFKLLVDTLMSHPQVKVTHLWIGPPASEESLARAAKVWGCRLPAALTTLYRQADGIQLRWVDSAHETYDPARDDHTHFQGPWHWLFEEPGVEAGLLDIPSIDELLGRDNIGDTFDLENHPLNKAVAFDSFGESQDAVLYFGDPPDDPWISVSSDHFADVPPPGERTLSQYLDHALSTWASIKHRHGDGPATVDGLLRERVPLDPPRIMGQRLFYVDEARGRSFMRGRVLGLVDIVKPSASWWFAPTLVEVADDLAETVYVPLRSLYPLDDADGYERLRDHPDRLRALFRGAAGPMFEDLAAIAEPVGLTGRVGQPAIHNHAWPYAALTSVFESREAAGLLLHAAQTLLGDPDVHRAHPVTWPKTRPRKRFRTTGSFGQLADGLFDAAAVHVARNGPRNLGSWLGSDATTRLRQTLQGIRAAEPLRGYDPLADTRKTPGFFASALDNGPTGFDTTPRAPLRGSTFGLADHRVVQG